MIDDSRDDDRRETTRIFGHLTLLRPTGELIRGVKVYECRCDCGNLDKATIPLLMMGRKTSCGCQNRSKVDPSKSGVLELERLMALLAADGRSLGEIAVSAGLAESLVVEGVVSKRKLTLATTGALLKAIGRHWGDLDEPVAPAADFDRLEVAPEAVPSDPLGDPSDSRHPLPRTGWSMLPNHSRPRHLSAILTRNRLEPPNWPSEGRTSMAPFADGQGHAFGLELF